MNILGYFQKVGKALMVPVATLPAAAILMGIGYWIDPAGWGGNSAVAAFLVQAGAAIIDNMSVLFAIGVAYGMSKDKDGAAALAGFVAYTVITTLLSPGTVEQIGLVALDDPETKLAFAKVGNQFIGILSGIVAAELYNRYYQVELPKALAFFSGKRLVPILTSFAGIILSFVLMYVWPVIFTGLVSFGEGITNLGEVGSGLYGFFNRLLIPVGLHHALNSVFWFDMAGINDLGNFWAAGNVVEQGGQLVKLNSDGEVIGVIGELGRYMGGYFPVMMFGLPGAALAIYHTAKPENKAKVASIMIAAGFASFFTGVTEPLEFSFMFLAPVLYVIHAALTGISLYIADLMNWTAGFGFSAGLVDMILSSAKPESNQWYMLILQGFVFFALYYTIFRTVIVKFGLKTPGREDDESAETSGVTGSENSSELAKQYLKALGGHSNIDNIDACITRLRLTIKDTSLISEKTLKDLGAMGVVKLGSNNVQVILGPLAEIVAGEMKNIPADADLSDVQLPA
ncbi:MULTISPECIES: N-acetylglucosamine-specific PTS transporter subunit IIBC [Vibrio]|uniref:N-acetylglucosamine-specific PTS transporter subunit IIBC n=1 Tax=Vibrio TaxID=662 RepID=UPI002075BEDB|nr:MULTISPECIES: N-acetylglucosamine-specific PTS transporter subunit IIBC [Vibrio]USD33197.1 PTS transporter subunit EIIBC [Vibrio sp. SCSIO 43186]USD46266.1 PTS transporter subunit EIIBC [Vibrio sp. SCSIO 43145]USD70321.1 PTS transporter subunit EIIBC [Vibrio sp. SCSIO 43139]USD95237.1 PTS glucose transporter subunit IIBC [Vibrio coralliilyticus]